MHRKRIVRLPVFFVGMLCLALAIVLLWNIARGIFNHRSSEIVQASIQRIELIVPASGFLSKTEYLILSPDDGKVVRLQEAGELVRPKTEIIQLKKGARVVETISNEHEGIISYIKDECEQNYVVGNLDQLLLQEILNPPVKQSRVGDDQAVKKNDFIFKIVENDIMHFVLVIDSKHNELIDSIFKDTFKIDGEVNFRVENPTNLFLGGTIQSIKKREKDQILLVFSTPYYIDTLLNNRKVSGFFTFGYVTASLLPKTAVIKGEDGKYYVFERKDKPKKIEVTLKGLDPFTQQYIVGGLETSQEIYIDASQWVKPSA